MLLDLSLALDPMNHKILLDTLGNCVGLSGPVLSWFRSYLEGRRFVVYMVENISGPGPMSCGALLRLQLFSLDIHDNNGAYHSYADDTQIYFQQMTLVH